MDQIAVPISHMVWLHIDHQVRHSRIASSAPAPPPRGLGGNEHPRSGCTTSCGHPRTNTTRSLGLFCSCGRMAQRPLFWRKIGGRSRAALHSSGHLQPGFCTKSNQECGALVRPASPRASRAQCLALPSRSQWFLLERKAPVEWKAVSARQAKNIPFRGRDRDQIGLEKTCLVVSRRWFSSALSLRHSAHSSSVLLK